jgi:5,10-methylenetetrahydromethanopterin reductase
MADLEFWHFSRPAIDGLAEHAMTLEAQGWDGMSLTDSQNLSPDVYVALSVAAQATTRLQLGPGVTNPVTRHPAVTAGAIASVHALSQGRAMLGLGRGDSSLFNIGRKPAPRAEFEPYLTAVQAYLRGETTDQHGYPSALRWLDTSAGKVTVDVAATGPKVIAIGARHAERVTFALGADAGRVRWALDQLSGATPEGREPASPGLYINVCVHDDVTQAAEMVRPGVGIFAHFSGMSAAGAAPISAADRAVFAAVESGYDRPGHGHGDAAHARALPVDFIERFAVIGPPAVCIERLRTLIDTGIERFFVIGPRPDHFGDRAAAATERFAREVMPALRVATHR